MLAGKHILVVEDEYLIASDVRRALEAEHAKVVGPVGDLGQALELVADERIDAAILDVNLGGTDSYGLADRLQAQAVPYMFLTGYDEWSLPDSHQAVPYVAKPFAMHTVIETVAQMLNSEVKR